MTWRAVAGATFRIEDGPSGEKHLYFVLNDPISIDEYGMHSCVVVNISTPKVVCDRTCMLQAGWHPSITHESFVYYQKARVRQSHDLEKLVTNRTYTPGTPAELKLVKYIVSFMHDAPELDDEIKDYAKRIEVQLAAKK